MSGQAPRVGFCVSGRGTGVAAALEAARRGVIGIEPALVLCDRPSPVADAAREHDVAFAGLDYAGFPSRAAFESAVDAAIGESRCEWLMLNYNRLLPQSTLSLVNGQALNLHMSLLPLFTGFGAVSKALASGMKIAGVTIHQADLSVDGGPILAQASAPILSDDDEATLGWRLFKLALPLQLQMLRLVGKGRVALENGRLTCRGEVAETGAFSPSVDADILQFADRFCESLPRS